MNERLFERILAHDGVLVLEREAPKLFRPRGTIPDWLGLAIRPEDFALATREPSRAFHFLDHFLDDAEEWWHQGVGGELRSGPWTESAITGDDLHLEASACVLAETGYLLVRHIEVEYERTHRALQTGRELSLAHEQLLSETSKKEILLHCIVHDLNGPLQGISGTFNLLKREALTPAGQKFLKLGQEAARQQANFIANMLDTFRAEVSSLETLTSRRAQAPDIVAEARGVMNALAPAFELRGTTVRLVLTPGTPGRLPVIGERTRLERIFHNLLENALRHSPRGSQITLTITRDEESVFVAVDDCGPGVEPGIASQLFQKFVRGDGQVGKVGLGLYFCRITVEQWGGEIGCNPRPEGGTRFWFRLRRP